MYNKHFILFLIVLLGCLSCSIGQENVQINRKHIKLSEQSVWEEISEDGKLMDEYAYLASLSFYEFEYMSEGHLVKGAMIEPSTPGTYPAIVFNRGGNRDFAQLSIHTLVNYTSKLAAESYVIIGSNYRTEDEFGGADIADVLNLIDLCNSIEKIDTSRMGMLGWSRGGMMTYLAMSMTNKLKTAVVGNGPSNLFSTLSERPGLEKNVFSQCIPNYYENKNEELEKRSVIFWPEKLNPETSLLILAGTNDKHVSYKQAEELSIVLEGKAPYHELKLFETDHFFSNQKDILHRELINWFERELKEEE